MECYRKRPNVWLLILSLSTLSLKLSLCITSCISSLRRCLYDIPKIASRSRRSEMAADLPQITTWQVERATSAELSNSRVRAVAQVLGPSSNALAGHTVKGRGLASPPLVQPFCSSTLTYDPQPATKRRSLVLLEGWMVGASTAIPPNTSQNF